MARVRRRAAVGRKLEDSGGNGNGKVKVANGISKVAGRHVREANGCDKKEQMHVATQSRRPSRQRFACICLIFLAFRKFEKAVLKNKDEKRRKYKINDKNGD
jgi:hypothetical protein